MYKYDFVRQLETKGGDKRQNVLHIDFTLLTILLVLCMTGLFVLYSASEQSMFYVNWLYWHVDCGAISCALLGALGDSVLCICINRSG